MKHTKHYTETGEHPYCNYALEHFSTAVHSKLLSDEKSRVETLLAERRTLEAQLGKPPHMLGRDHQELLIELARALSTGETFAKPATGSQTTDDTKTGRQKPHSMEPTGGDRHAARALNRLVRTVTNAIDQFETSQRNDFKPPIDFDPGPKTRCWTRGCPNRAKTFTDECPGCGKRANPVPNIEQPALTDTTREPNNDRVVAP